MNTVSAHDTEFKAFWDAAGIQDNIPSGSVQAPIQSPFYPRILSAMRSNSWTCRLGQSVPEVFSDYNTEYNALVSGCAIHDDSDQHLFEVSGDDSQQYISRLTTSDVASMKAGDVSTSPICDRLGGVIDITLIFRFGENRYFIQSDYPLLRWLTDSMMGFVVKVAAVNDQFACLSLAGPKHEKVAHEIAIKIPNSKETGYGFSLNDFGRRGFVLKSNELDISNDRLKIWIKRGSALALWDQLTNAESGAVPIGDAVFDLKRIEVGTPRVGIDYVSALDVIQSDRLRTPFELGYADAVDFSKPNFNGRAALKIAAARDMSSTVEFVSISFDGGLPNPGTLLFTSAKAEPVGVVTSARYSHGAGLNLGLGFVLPQYSKLDTELTCEIAQKVELISKRKPVQARIL